MCYAICRCIVSNHRRGTSDGGTPAHLDIPSTLADLREAVETLEDVERIARRVFGGAHPLTMGIEDSLQEARDGSRELIARLAT